MSRSYGIHIPIRTGFTAIGQANIRISMLKASDIKSAHSNMRNICYVLVPIDKQTNQRKKNKKREDTRRTANLSMTVKSLVNAVNDFPPAKYFAFIREKSVFYRPLFGLEMTLSALLSFCPLTLSWCRFGCHFISDTIGSALFFCINKWLDRDILCINIIVNFPWMHSAFVFYRY